jgi:hypothetical protein
MKAPAVGRESSPSSRHSHLLPASFSCGTLPGRPLPSPLPALAPALDPAPAPSRPATIPAFSLMPPPPPRIRPVPVLIPAEADHRGEAARRRTRPQAATATACPAAATPPPPILPKVAVVLAPTQRTLSSSKPSPGQPATASPSLPRGLLRRGAMTAGRARPFPSSPTESRWARSSFSPALQLPCRSLAPTFSATFAWRCSPVGSAGSP